MVISRNDYARKDKNAQFSEAISQEELIERGNEKLLRLEKDVIFEGKTSPKSLALHDIGTELLEFLFRSENNGSRNGFRSIAGTLPSKENIILEIETPSPVLLRYPWECCAFPDWEKLGVSRSEPRVIVTRTVGNRAPPKQLIEPVQILVAGASPIDNPVPNIDKEHEAITKALSNLHESRFKAPDPETKLTISDLGHIARNVKPHILHLISHGSTGGVLLEDWEGNKELFDAKSVATHLEDGSERLVLFISTACEAFREPLSPKKPGLGDSLTSLIPIAIGMQLAIKGNFAIMFAREFYYHLSDHKSVLESFVYARDKLYKNGTGAEGVAPVYYEGQKEYSQYRIFRENEISAFIESFISAYYDILDRLNTKFSEKHIWIEMHEKFVEINTRVLTPVKRRKIKLLPSYTDIFVKLDNLYHDIRELFLELDGIIATNSQKEYVRLGGHKVIRKIEQRSANELIPLLEKFLNE